MYLRKVSEVRIAECRHQALVTEGQNKDSSYSLQECTIT
jgi:hypothetical protein